MGRCPSAEFPRGQIGMTALIFALAGQALAGITPHAALDMTSVRVFRTEAGLELALPEISSLGCAEMKDVLSRIDGTHYRADGIPEPSELDFALFLYEDQLSRALFHDCIIEVEHGMSSTIVFTDGFDRQ